MEVAICAIVRLENKYIKEWIDYHLSIGFSHIYLYDNNREGEERIADVVDTDICYKESVTIIPFHHEHMYPQMRAYNDCWNHYMFDWILYIDIDEFFTFGKKWTEEHNIQQFVHKYEQNGDAILLNWMCYGDNGHLVYSDSPLTQRFSKPLPLLLSATNMWGKQPINGHVKTLVRHDCDFQVCNPHVGSGNYRVCNADGIEVNNEAWQSSQTYGNAYLRHYYTKTIQEYVEHKVKRGLADRTTDRTYPLADFFMCNRITFRKLYYYRKYKKSLGINRRERTYSWWMKMLVKHSLSRYIIDIKAYIRYAGFSY